MAKSFARLFMSLAALGIVLATAISTDGQTPQALSLDSLRAAARQLRQDSAFDRSQHAVADSQFLTVEQPGPPVSRTLGPYARVWPRSDNHERGVEELVGRIVALVVSDGPYTSLGLPAGSSYVYIESLDPSGACVPGQSSNGQARIVPADSRYDAQSTSLVPRPLCYTENPRTEHGFLGIGRRPHKNRIARAEWRSPNDGIWVACSPWGCCQIGSEIQ